MNRKVFQYGDVPLGTELQVLLHFRHGQIFGDNLPNTDLFHVQLTSNHSKSQLTIATLYLPNPLDTDLSFLLKSSRSCGHLSPPRRSLWTFCATKKKTCMRDMMLSPYTCRSILNISDGVFSNQTEISGLFVPQFLYLTKGRF